MGKKDKGRRTHTELYRKKRIRKQGKKDAARVRLWRKRGYPPLGVS